MLVGKFGSVKSTLTNCLTGLAFGTLLSDTLLHLIPAVCLNKVYLLRFFCLNFHFKALNIHGHGADEDAHDEDAHDEHDSTYVWVLSVTIAS